MNFAKPYLYFPLCGVLSLGIVWALPMPDKNEFVKLSCKPGRAPWIEPDCEAPIMPHTMVIRFVPQKEFDEAAGGEGWGGLADPDKSLCVIMLPAKGSISASPDNGEASWRGDAAGLTSMLPHEILHCLAGHWHNDPYPPSYFYNLRWKNSEPGREYELENLAYVPKFKERYGFSN